MTNIFSISLITVQFFPPRTYNFAFSTCFLYSCRVCAVVCVLGVES